MSRSTPVPSYPETTDADALGPAERIGPGDAPDGLENLTDERPLAHFRSPRQRNREAVEAGLQAYERDVRRRQIERAAQRAGSTAGAPAEAAGRGAAPGLVLEGRMASDPDGVGWTLRDDECPLDGALAFDRTTGEVAWRPTCKNARCRRCSRQVSAQTFALARRATADLDRVRFITLTRAPEGWEATRQALKVCRRNLDRHGVAGEWLWVVEKGSETGMKHVHAVQWGPKKIPMDVLDASWPHGSNQIESARAASDYLAKGVLRYVAKEIDGGEESIESHMNLNGGRAAHWSTGFYAGMGRNAYRQAHPLPGVYFVETFKPRRDEP